MLKIKNITIDTTNEIMMKILKNIINRLDKNHYMAKRKEKWTT